MRLSEALKATAYYAGLFAALLVIYALVDIATYYLLGFPLDGLGDLMKAAYFTIGGVWLAGRRALKEQPDG